MAKAKNYTEAIEKMQDALDFLVGEAEKEKSIWLADAVDNLAVAIQYTQGVAK